MSKHLTQKEKDLIKREYLDGLSYRKIQKKYGYSLNTISRYVKGLASHADRCKLSHDNGTWVLSDKGRKKLSENGKKACQKNGKMWTKPEREFKKILNELNIGVQFPEYIADMFKVKSDDEPIICYQYPIQRYVCDFVSVLEKIVFRVQGDFWHGNPLLYKKEDLTKIQKFNISRDKNKKIYLEKNDWIVIDMWESEIYWNKELVKDKIKATRVMSSLSTLHVETSRFESGVAYSEDWSNRLQELWFKKPKGRPKKEKKKKNCLYCEKEFEVKKAGKDKETKYCSYECYRIDKRKIKDRPSKEQLLNEIKALGYCGTGKKYGVSDNAVRKWLK